MKSWKKTLSLIALLGVLLIVGAIIAIKVLFPAEEIKAQIENEASNAIGREIKVGDIGVSFWPLGLEIQSLSVGGPKDSTFSAKPSLTSENLVLKVDIPSLFKGQASINQVSIGSFQFNFEWGI